jgi:hypothetical protein
MSRVPVLNSPCPFRMSAAPRPGQDFCGQCQRQVHNLDLLSAQERETFFSTCGETVCVSYTLRRPMRASIALSASLVAAAALAGAPEVQAPVPETTAAPELTLLNDGDDELELVLITGGTVIRDELKWVDEADAVPHKADLPEIAAVTWLPAPKS